MKNWAVITNDSYETNVRYFETKQEALDYARENLQYYISVFVAELRFMTVTYNSFEKAITLVEV